jgi:hypothetical protein
MDILKKDDIKKLSENNSYPSVSIFIPTHKEWNERKKDITRYRNQLTKAEKILSEIMREKELNNFLKPSKNLLDDTEFWNHQNSGLAVFFNKDEFKTYRVPQRVEEFLFINNVYYLKPLLPLLSGDGRFFLLSFDQKQTKLYEGTKYSIKELNIPNTITSFEELMKFYEAERSVQFHSSTGQTTAQGRTGDRAAMFHGHGTGGDEKIHKKNLTDFAHIIDKGVHKILRDETAPLIIAAVEYLVPIYKNANSYPYLNERHLPLNPEEFGVEKLHEKAWALIKPVFENDSKIAFSKYEQFSGNGKASSNIEEILKASLANRVEYLWVDLDEHHWGTYNEADQRVELENESTQFNKDLLDFAATQTILNNGTVYALRKVDMPIKKPALAVFRF